MKNKLLVLILTAAFLIRFIGTNPGYNPYHSDEPAIYGSAIEMIGSPVAREKITFIAGMTKSMA